MNNHSLRPTLVSSRSLVASLSVALVVLFTCSFALASGPQGSFEKTLTVNGPVDLNVETRSGDITIRAGSTNSVVIRGKIYIGDHWLRGNRESDIHEIEQNPPIHQEGNSVRIDHVNYHDIAVSYEITVPTETTIRAHSGSGDQIIEGTKGNVDVQAGSGDLKLAHLTGELQLHTGSGNVRAREISGSIRGGAGSGDLEVEEVGSGEVELRTGSGNISVRGVHGAFRAEAGSGDITVEGTQSASWEIHTGSGNVRVHLPNNAAFDADISTSSGTVDVDSPLEMTVQGRVQDIHKNIRGKVRGGGPLLSVRTGSGDVHVQ